MVLGKGAVLVRTCTVGRSITGTVGTTGYAELRAFFTQAIRVNRAE